MHQTARVITLRIDSAIGPSHFELQQSSPADWQLRVAAAGLTIALQVDPTGYRYVEGLGDYFGRLAGDWRGWDGERAWDLLEFGLVASHDGLGHIEFRVRVRESSQHGWAADVGIQIDAGQLDAVARAAARFDKTAY